MEKNNKSKYDKTVNRFIGFCQKREADPYNSNDNIIVALFTEASERGVPSSALKAWSQLLKRQTTKPAQKLLENQKGCIHFMSNCYKNHETWDAFTLLQYLGTMSITPLKHIRMKMAILIMLLSQHRVDTLDNSKSINMYFIWNWMRFCFWFYIKTQNRSNHPEVFL